MQSSGAIPGTYLTILLDDSGARALLVTKHARLLQEVPQGLHITVQITYASLAVEQRLNCHWAADREPDIRHPEYRPNDRHLLHRSEERRVGKECRSRWSP